MMFENFILNPEILEEISGHHETGEPLHEDLRQKLIDVKEVGYDYRTNRFIHIFSSFKKDSYLWHYVIWLFIHPIQKAV